MSNLISISDVRGFVDQTGTAHLNLEDVARGLGFTQRAASGNESIRWERVKGYLIDMKVIPTSGDGQIPEFIPENIFYRLAMKAKNEVAEVFQAKVADEILPAIRKQGIYSVKPMTQVEILHQTVTLLAEQEKQLQRIEEKQDLQADQIRGIRDIVALNAFDNWRESTTGLINRIVDISGIGFDRVRAESYKLLCKRFGVSLIRRLKNRQRVALLNGATKSSVDQMNFLDVIDTDKKLIEGYVAIVKDMAIRSGV